MINNKIGFLAIFIVLFLMYFILKKNIENFNTIIIRGDIEKKINNDKNLFRFGKLCIGKTCIDSNVLTALVDLFKTKESIVKESICNDNVCLLPSHLKIFNNEYISKPKIYNLNNENDISKINSFKAQSGNPDTTGGFKLALVEDTDTLLNEFNIKDSRYKTKMMSGRICYAPRTSSKFNVNYYNINDSFPKKTTTKNISDYTDCFRGTSQSFRMGKPYDIFNEVNLNVKDDSNRNDDKVAENTKIKYTKGTIKVASIS